jgi:2-phosphoglycerate kinase
MENFDTIRKTQNFLVQQAEIHDTRIINNVDINETIDMMVSDILEEFGGVENVKQKS